MKKYFTARLFASLAATFAVTFLFAQDQNSVAANPLKSAQANAIAALIGEPIAEPASTATYVKAKVMRSFLQLFSNATDVKWAAADGHYLVKFIQNSRLCKAVFRDNGFMVYCLKYGTDKDLPRDFRRLLKSAYLDYTVDVAIEVNTHDLNAWIVNLSDSDNLVVVRLHDGDMEEVHHYKTHF